jgi:hypothetical protein
MTLDAATAAKRGAAKISYRINGVMVVAQSNTFRVAEVKNCYQYIKVALA